MTRTELERIAVVETQLDAVQNTLRGVDGKLDYIIAHFDSRVSFLEEEQLVASTERRTIAKLVGVGMVLIPTIMTILLRVVLPL
jgi:hypothetical protein